jgi:hypothetical protein
MSKYIQLKNKQRLAKALSEIGMTVDEAKQWLQESSAQQKETPEPKASADMDDALDIAAYLSVWFKDHENAYPTAATPAPAQPTAKKCSGAAGPCNVSESAKSNVTFIPGNAQNKALLLVGGVAVQGDFKACYSFDSTSGNSTLQVEFINPV